MFLDESLARCINLNESSQFKRSLKAHRKQIGMCKLEVFIELGQESVSRYPEE